MKLLRLHVLGLVLLACGLTMDSGSACCMGGGAPKPSVPSINERPNVPRPDLSGVTRDDRDSPHARCKPSAGPRQIGTAYGFEMVEFPELQRVIIFDVGGPHTFRIVYMDGRQHPCRRCGTYEARRHRK